MKEGLTMHYPYNPVSFDPSHWKPYDNAGGDNITSMPSQAAETVRSAFNPLTDFPAPAPINPPVMQPPSAPPAANPSPQQPPAEMPQPRLVETVKYTGPEIPFGSAAIPVVLPEPPFFSVPSNPLLPEEYKEILSYSNLQYLNGFLRTQIGKECMIVSTLGASGNITNWLGYLIGVGANYILLQDGCSGGIMAIDFYSIHMVQIMGRKCPVNLLI